MSKPWRDIEKELYLFTCGGIRGVYSEKDIRKGMLVTVYPNEHEVSKKSWDECNDDELRERCSDYALERAVDRRGNKAAGKYIFLADKATDPPPFGHLLNHCKDHPNLKVCYQNYLTIIRKM